MCNRSSVQKRARPRVVAANPNGTVAALLLGFALAPALAQELLPPVDVREIDPSRGLIHVHAPRASLGAHMRLVVLEGDRCRIALPAGEQDGLLRFRLPPDAQLSGDATRAWLLPADLAPRTINRWPDGVMLHAPVTSASPGLRSLWLAAGELHGVRLGDVWWRRVGGQPVARGEVRLVERDRCFLILSPMVSDLRIGVGDEFERWGSRADAGQTVRSAVVYVESDGAHASQQGEPSTTPVAERSSPAANRPSIVGGSPAPGVPDSATSLASGSDVAAGVTQLLWIAAPPGFRDLPDPRVDVFREGEFIAHGVAERRDGLFWYVRTLPAASRGRAQAGDDAHVRTPKQIEQRSFTARVLARQGGEELINAGELDGLRVGDLGEVFRSAEPIGRVVIHSVQRGYSAVRWAPPQPDAAPLPALGPLDEVYFAPRSAPPADIGGIESVADDVVLRIELHPRASEDARQALREGSHCSIASARGEPIGAALLLDVTGDRAIGVAIRESLTGPLSRGMRVRVSPR